MNLKDAVKEAIEVLREAEQETVKLYINIERNWDGSYFLHKAVETKKDGERYTMTWVGSSKNDFVPFTTIEA